MWEGGRGQGGGGCSQGVSGWVWLIVVVFKSPLKKKNFKLGMCWMCGRVYGGLILIRRKFGVDLRTLRVLSTPPTHGC